MNKRGFFLDIGILERDNQLEGTIGTLDKEKYSFELSKLLVWLLFPCWILLSVLQSICFLMFHGKYHPLAEILIVNDGSEEIGN